MIAVVDTESTGVPSNPRARVVEIGAVVLDPHDDYAEVASYEQVFYPHGFDARLDGPGLARSGISALRVIGSVPERTVRQDFSEFLRLNNVTEVLSYNRAFDETMLKRSGVVLPWTGCIMRMARAAMPARKKDPPLFEAAEFFLREIPVDTPHRALPDARLAALVFAAIRRRGG